MSVNIKKLYNDPLYIRNIDNPTEDEQIEAVKRNGMVIKFINNPSNVVKREAILNNPLCIEYIEDLPEELAILAVQLLWNSIKYVKNLTNNIMREAVKSKGWAIQFIENPPEEIKLLAVEKDFDAIKYIKNPSEEVQIRAIETYWGAIRFIDNPTLEARRCAIKIDEESINYIMNYDFDDLKIFIGDNINIVKYVYDSIDIDTILEIIKEKICKDDIDNKYMRDFLELEVLEMDKIDFVKNYGSKNTKMTLIDYKLGL
ncbi:hypothetical protein [Clostridium disporicum]|uniref:DUF4116 domain-containing protein n=1 Tax=Clostridium disporicum TaxID=84024 RepID=A0A174EUA8_9CLOT|nr:hypothetical protein [Clostridium disporicum]CUO41543.1 Uncharacterised protein [Clostridium disporicum]